MDHHTLEIPFLSRFFSHGELSNNTRHIWIVCHGYGQLAQYFIKKFEVLDPKLNYVVAPEGMNRFYLEGFSGRVGATWMTKEDRQTDIENYTRQLNTLYNSIPKEILANSKIHLLGFSQGTATVSRWLMNSGVEFESLIIWAGSIANEIKFPDLASRLKDAHCYLVLGTQDEFYSEGLWANYHKKFLDAKISAEQILFEGGHSLDEQTILLLESRSQYTK